jgi:hypothetical protein
MQDIALCVLFSVMMVDFEDPVAHAVHAEVRNANSCSSWNGMVGES